VLGRSRPNGDSLLAVSAVVDGVVTFEATSDAERFTALLEADGIDEARALALCRRTLCDEARTLALSCRPILQQLRPATLFTAAVG